MIRVNLYKKSNQDKLQSMIANVVQTFVMHARWKWLIVVVGIFFLNLGINVFYFNGIINELKAVEKQKVFVLEKLQKEIKEKAGLDKQIRAFKAQEEMMQKKFEMVGQVIKMRGNPMNIMLDVAKNMPKDTWIDELVIKNTSFTLRGQSKSYSSIAALIEALKLSDFFSETLRISEAKTEFLTEKDRTEKFTLKGDIKRFN